jgi:hypothetical protein
MYWVYGTGGKELCRYLFPSHVMHGHNQTMQTVVRAFLYICCWTSHESVVVSAYQIWINMCKLDCTCGNTTELPSFPLNKEEAMFRQFVIQPWPISWVPLDREGG